MWRNSVGGLIVLVFLLVSCKSTETVNIGNVSNITDAKLRIQLKDNQLDYTKMYLKKVQFSYNNGDVKKSFKGSFVIEKDSQIIVSIYALMGIELIRAKLTHDDVIIIDKHNKIVLKTGYNYLNSKYGIELDFNTIQSIITNSLFLYPSEEDYFDGLKKYKHHVGDNYYSFKSLKDKRLGRLNRRSKNNIVIHEVDIYPDIFRIFRVYVKDFSSNQSFKIDYNNFEKFGRIMFPSHIDFSANSGNKNFNIDLKVNYLEINDGGSLHFKTPSNYEVKEL